MILLYRVFRRLYERKGDPILYDSFKCMNLSIFCFWPRRRQKYISGVFKIVPGFFSKKIFYFFSPFKTCFSCLISKNKKGSWPFIYYFYISYRKLRSFIITFVYLFFLYRCAYYFSIGLITNYYSLVTYSLVTYSLLIY
jgi:hypothetical protein